MPLRVFRRQDVDTGVFEGMIAARGQDQGQVKYHTVIIALKRTYTVQELCMCYLPQSQNRLISRSFLSSVDRLGPSLCDGTVARPDQQDPEKFRYEERLDKVEARKCAADAW